MARVEPQSRHSTTVHVLWARADRYPRPQFIAAWPDGLVDAWYEWYLELRAEAIQRWEDFDDQCPSWTYWMTVEDIEQPTEVGEPIEVDRAPA